MRSASAVWISNEFLVFYSAHPFIKKEWYNVQVPSNFDISTPTLTPCNKTAGQSKFLKSDEHFSCSLLYDLVERVFRLVW